jgi:hypothetical protein
MPQIREEQMQAFQREADVVFERRLAGEIRARQADTVVRLPGRTLTVRELPEATLQEMVRDGIERARGYGMTFESSLAAFVVLMFVVAPNFDEHPVVQRRLSDEKVQADARVQGLAKEVPEADWEAARDSYDPGAWKLTEEE